MPMDQAVKTAPEVQLQKLAKGARTRERILDLAYDAIIAKGFAATSIDELIEGAGISRSGFFYHFKDKNDLARQLIQRSQDETERHLDAMEAEARRLHEDPLHAFLIFLKLYEDMMSEMLKNHPGCVVQAVIMQDRAFDPEVRTVANEMTRAWRARFLNWLTQIADKHPLRMKVSLVDLADHPAVVVDGAIVLGKATGDFDAVRRQANLTREVIRLAFGAA